MHEFTIRLTSDKKTCTENEKIGTNTPSIRRRYFLTDYSKALHKLIININTKQMK